MVALSHRPRRHPARKPAANYDHESRLKLFAAVTLDPAGKVDKIHQVGPLGCMEAYANEYNGFDMEPQVVLRPVTWSIIE